MTKNESRDQHRRLPKSYLYIPLLDVLVPRKVFLRVAMTCVTEVRSTGGAPPTKVLFCAWQPVLGNATGSWGTVFLDRLPYFLVLSPRFHSCPIWEALDQPTKAVPLRDG